MKKKKFKSNPIAKSKTTGEHGPKPSVQVHKSKNKYLRKKKHNENFNLLVTR